MARIIEARIKISDLKQFKELLRCVSTVLVVYEAMGHHLNDSELIEALEGLLAAREALRDL